ncbi:two-component system, NarL family, sensor histidine kinase BarA [Halopseudomonas yangmingensis]|uniref:histidine kinase n=2 Tax=Halopseudomonas yangmingensis TaxID=1720063 RepID=A0A1I4N6E1_9GAMM|nr:two-component system, NarL family, sensor histidine kinase BarA [Halopseudomonas yangmingensis]
MTQIGIKARLLLMTLVPASVLAVTLGIFFSWQHISLLEQQLLDRGLMTVEHLRTPAYNSLRQGSEETSRQLLKRALNHTDVRAISLYDAEQQQLQHSGPVMYPPTRTLSLNHQTLYSGVQIQASEHSRRFLLPLTDTDELLHGWLEVELDLHPTRLQGYRALLAMLAAIITGLGFSALVVSLLGRHITDPVARLNQAIQHISRGQFDIRLRDAGSRELNDLAGGINSMAAALQSAQGEMQQNIEQATEDLRQTLETIEVQNIELDLARKAAQEASRTKSEFLANMSHELRTPLNGILGFSNLLQRTELNPRQQEYLGTIEKSADNLLVIINEILDFSKIEAGKLTLENLPFNLRDLVQDTLTMLAPAAHQKDLELASIIYRDTPLGVSGDAQRIKQVLANLISNAIKFTRQGSVCVRVMLENEDAHQVLLRISVTDTGVGLSAEQQKSLFRAFSQVDNSLTRQSGGTGLGLVIAKRLVEQMQGEIGLHSELGRGTDFWFTLRLNKSRQVSDDLPVRPFEGMRAAVLEPHLQSRQSLQHALEDLGLQLRLFSDLQQLDQTLRQPPSGQPPMDLVVLSTRLDNFSPQDVIQLARDWAVRDLGRIMLLSDSHEHYPELDSLPQSHCQSLSRPVCHRKLYRAASRLLHPDTSRQDSLDQLPRVDGVSVLCVDDNPANLRLVQTFLLEMGARVLTAESGEQALALLADQPVDLIFMDVQMPGMDGRQTTAELRLREQQSGSPTVPVIALTAHALADERRQLLLCGMNDYLCKPITPEQLGHCIRQWTGQEPMQANTGRATAAPSTPNTDNILAVLDLNEGLQLAAGKQDLAQDMLDMLLKGLDEEYRLIEALATGNQHAELLEQVHRLHGATRYCGVPQLRECCRVAEESLKLGKDYRSSIDNLLQAIRRLQQQARNLQS